jgi:bifunctional non-homologous end joining protein LigD
MAEMQWVTPKLVAQIRFVEWTEDGHLRHSAFLGLRTDKQVTEVRRET